jgi:steroid 5-alpha reductase family enzyme
LNILDFVAAFLVLGFIVIETIADQQQWDFQQAKKKAI